MDEREMSAVGVAADEEAKITAEDTTLAEEAAAPPEDISPEAEESGTEPYTDEGEDSGESYAPDYREIVESDLRTLRAAYPELSEIKSITELENPLRYAELRDLGLSPKEAYLATGGHRRRADNRAHLSSAVPRGAGSPRSNMTHVELERARELFPGLGDAELHGLYKKVSV